MKKNDLEDKEQSNQAREEDIDIAQLFVLIGKGFSSIINFIVSLFNTIFGWFLLFIIFIRANLKKMIIVALIGGSLGAVYQYGLKEIQYESSMTVEPNFGSTVQLYKNIDYYLSLVK